MAEEWNLKPELIWHNQERRYLRSTREGVHVGEHSLPPLKRKVFLEGVRSNAFSLRVYLFRLVRTRCIGFRLRGIEGTQWPGGAGGSAQEDQPVPLRAVRGPKVYANSRTATHATAHWLTHARSCEARLNPYGVAHGIMMLQTRNAARAATKRRLATQKCARRSPRRWRCRGCEARLPIARTKLLCASKALAFTITSRKRETTRGLIDAAECADLARPHSPACRGSHGPDSCPFLQST